MYEQRPSPNFNTRKHGEISAIVIHDTASRTSVSALSWLTSPMSKLSAHYLIGKDGQIYQLVQDENRAWHAGKSSLWGVEDVNEYSIGIELVNDDLREPYSEEQFGSLIDLCTNLCLTYGIWLNRIVGHEHIAIPRGRKNDPGTDFPWNEFLTTLAANIQTDVLLKG